MAVITAADSLAGLAGYVNASISSALRSFAVDYWPTHQADIGTGPSLTMTRVAAAAHARAIAAADARSYKDDYYYRIHLLPAQLDLGNLISAQVRTIEVWNAWLATAQTLTAVQATNAAGITVTGPAALPLTFAPLQSLLWSVTVSTAGSPVIDATLSWLFTGLAAVPATVTGNRLTAWMLPPDWGSPITESLIWLTDIQQALDGSEYREPVRDTPRRQWEFSAIAWQADRQILELALYDWTARNWVLPVWPDMQPLSAALPAGSLVVPVATTGLDVAVGSLVMLWGDTRTYEMAEVAAVSANSVTLATATVSSWPAQTRVYPCRISRLTDAPKLTRYNDELTTTVARFEAVEACTWPAVAPAATYLGLPVLEDRIVTTQHPDAADGRQLVDLDGDVGLVYVDDITGLAWPVQSHAWLLAGVAARSALRSLLYWLQGKGAALWVPSWTDDVTLLADLTASSIALQVARVGITRHGQLQPGRRHLRVELYSGAVYYRRVTAVSIVDAATEQLAIDSTLGVAIATGDIRQISWLMLCRQASDTVQIAHVNDLAGVATVASRFAGIGAEEP